jgi:hypothetical protein
MSNNPVTSFQTTAVQTAYQQFREDTTPSETLTADMTKRYDELNTMNNLANNGAETLLYAYQTHDGNRVIIQQQQAHTENVKNRVNELKTAVATRDAEYKQLIGQNEYNMMISNILWAWAILFIIAAVLIYIMKKTNGNFIPYTFAIIVLTAIVITYTVIATRLNTYREPTDWTKFNFSSIFGDPIDPFAKDGECPAPSTEGFTTTTTESTEPTGNDNRQSKNAAPTDNNMNVAEGFAGSPTRAEAISAGNIAAIPFSNPSIVLNSSRNS